MVVCDFNLMYRKVYYLNIIIIKFLYKTLTDVMFKDFDRINLSLN